MALSALHPCDSCGPAPAVRWRALAPAERACRLGLGLLWPLAMATTPGWLQGGGGLGCPFRALTGLPCPLCGGTHACAAVVQGDWAGAWVASPGALLLLLLASLWAAQWIWEGAKGLQRVQPWPWAQPWALRGAALAVLGLWALRLWGAV